MSLSITKLSILRNISSNIPLTKPTQLRTLSAQIKLQGKCEPHPYFDPINPSGKSLIGLSPIPILVLFPCKLGCLASDTIRKSTLACRSGKMLRNLGRQAKHVCATKCPPLRGVAGRNKYLQRFANFCSK